MWNVWISIGEIAYRDALLAQIKNIAGFDYSGIHPTQSSLWWQVCDIHMLTMDVARRSRNYADVATKGRGKQEE